MNKVSQGTKKPQVPRDAGYGVGLPKEASEPFPDFHLSHTLAVGLCLHETAAIEATQKRFNGPPRFLSHASYARMEAWLDQVTADQPFDEVLFFDATNTVDSQGLHSLSFFSRTTLAFEELVVSSAVFCSPDGQFLYDRAAIREFIQPDAADVIFWGSEIKSLPQAASLKDPFLSLPSYTSTTDGRNNPFSFEYEIEDSSQAVIDIEGGDWDDDGDEDDDTESEASFGCVTVAAHDKALAEKKARPRVKQSDVLPFRRYLPWTSPKYVNRKSGPPPAIWIPSNMKQTLPIARPLKSFQRPAPHKDRTLSLRAMRANIRDAPIIWPTYPEDFGDIQHLPVPRMLARPPRPGLTMLQPKHPEVKAQWETAKPLYLECITKRPDPLPALHFPFERTPDSFHTLDLFRLPTATISPSAHSFQAYFRELVPAPLRIDSRGIWPRPGSYSLQSADPEICAQWKAVRTKPDNGLEKCKARTPLVLKPFMFLRKMLRAMTREREWLF